MPLPESPWPPAVLPTWRCAWCGSTSLVEVILCPRCGGPRPWVGDPATSRQTRDDYAGRAGRADPAREPTPAPRTRRRPAQAAEVVLAALVFGGAFGFDLGRGDLVHAALVAVATWICLRIIAAAGVCQDQALRSGPV